MNNIKGDKWIGMYEFGFNKMWIDWSIYLFMIQCKILNGSWMIYDS